ncbi:heavy-metal-associated domain-containing protein [Bacillus sp. RG28]|uniref:Heavy-metal-associated domain-containing protein n=1 Tax=Gottfriedia endophytica TaxID=2820819 RepID=A0A940SKN7_9BACI|nr:copper ion binding protein [Gottfriedia endophytica]MBP0725448.1 heavy-metal-associated domain-containing protein [Gottfriedia endophytica]
MVTVLVVEGMTCNHCKAAVTKAVEGVSGVESVDVNLESKEVKINHREATSIETVKEAIEDQGYDLA